MHQVKSCKSRATAPFTHHSSPLTSFPDLADALETPVSADAGEERWRIHFHLPLYYSGDGILGSTANTLDGPFWKSIAAAQLTHLEIETYTFHVLPPALQAGGIESSIAGEYDWVRQRLAQVLK